MFNLELPKVGETTLNSVLIGLSRCNPLAVGTNVQYFFDVINTHGAYPWVIKHNGRENYSKF